MKRNTSCPIVKLIVLITYLGMITVNALAVLLPINGITPAEVSDLYPNLFTPAGLTFSIWGLIYGLLALFTGYLLFSVNALQRLICKIGVLFSLTSVVNILWVFAWHYQIIPLTVGLMLILLVCLIWIMQLASAQELTRKETFFIKLPFAVYLGWITVATIANITVLLVSLGWDGFGLPEQTWTMLVLTLGAVIGILTGLRFQSVAYFLVLIWAYVGIIIKNTTAGFKENYLGVGLAAAVMIVAFVIAAGFLIVKKARGRSRLEKGGA